MFALFRLTGYLAGPVLTGDQIHAIAGEPARLAATDAPVSRLTVVTWNIEQGSRFDGILAVLRDQDADVILLQEADRFCRRSGYRDVPRELAHALDMNWVSAGEFQEIGESRGNVPATTGQAILSKYPIEHAEAIVFVRQSAMRWRINPVQPRRGARMALHAQTAGITVYNVHLESSGADAVRDAQIKDVLGRDAWAPRSSTVIGGDFNNTARAIPPLMAAVSAHGFLDALGPADSRQTSIRHRHPIDWLFARDIGLTRGRVQRVERLSDHFPLTATLDLSHEER